MSPEPAKTFTGLTRKRKTSKLVHAIDVLARATITIGGLGTIIAVLTVCVFLVWVAVPLLFPATTSLVRAEAVKGSGAKPVNIGVDEFGLMGWSFYADGTLEITRLDGNKTLDRKPLFAGTKPTCWVFSSQYPECAFGFADGTVKLGKIGFDSSFVDPGKLPENLKSLRMGDEEEYDGGMLQLTGGGQFRLEKIKIEIGEPVDVTPGKAISMVDYATQSDGGTLAALSEDGTLKIEKVTTKENMMTGKTSYDTDESIVPFNQGKYGKPMKLLLGGQGDMVFLPFEDGKLLRYNTAYLTSPEPMEEVKLVESGKITAAALINGRATIVVGDSNGTVGAWFATKPDEAKTQDGAVTVKAHELPGDGSKVTAFGSSALSRLLLVGYEDGGVRLFHVTSEKFMAEQRAQDKTPVELVLIHPKDDGLTALSGGFRTQWFLNPGSPETTFNSLFGKVWYEGYPRPQYVWQSSSATDESEPKFSLVPLIFGTIKATFFSLLFGVPIALMAAIYTSEFLHPVTKARIKPAVETMASLPSVVLGFLAAIIFAPVVEDYIPSILSSFVTVPVSFLIGAYLWQLIPQRTSIRMLPYRFFFTSLMLPIGIMMAAGTNWVPGLDLIPGLSHFHGIGPIVEREFFAGDIRLWLTWKLDPKDPASVASPYHSPLGGWIVILIPVCGILVGFFMARVVNSWLRVYAGTWERPTAAMMDVVKFIFAIVVTILLATTIASALTGMGLDPRGSIVDTYAQRNALIVGFVMGFAIIPIVYTISEDALASVPDHLRSASLGCGATPWQTTIRIVVPTAMSGLFSAIMIGVGRAVGETMIVLMAAGNTPIMDMNIFNGFRTLSANIATELPEAVKNSTHYRTLFLAALILFLMTFVLNTIAEVVRNRFRKKAVQL